MADLRCYLTTAGIAAENNAKQFGSTLKITEMVFDGSYLADEQNPENLTEVINPVLTVPCSTSISDDEQTLTFKGSIQVEQGGFNVWGIGLKTEDGTLYGYARSKGDKILTEDEGATESIRYAVDIITKNADVIEIKINQSTVYADLEDVDNAIKAHETKPDPHEQYAKSATAQMLPYNPNRTYKQNETCTTFNAVTGELEIWTSYAPTDNTGNDPQDPANRHDEWPNFPTPCWWIKHHAVEPGTPVYWLSDDIPENALQIMDT
ncbi:MAG: phage tail protein, partial [Vibrio sp.]|uniref:phage tail-collar fiber domain-containing protein n=1 Tax=Vibrio sp. TaxID=678 RepID=UPI003A85D261